MAADESTATAVVTAAEIARFAGVTRAAVSNWRRRYPDFPRPTAGTGTSPLFDLAEVRQWLDRQGKGQEPSGEVDLWRELRAQYGDDLTAALRGVGARLLPDDRAADIEPLADSATTVVTSLVGDRGARPLFEGLVERVTTSTARSGGEPMTPARLARIVAEFATLAGSVTETVDTPSPRSVYDPACGMGTLLLASGPSSADRYGQDASSDTAAVAVLRARLTGGSATVACGDSLRQDLLPELCADLVVCEPPVGVADWGRDTLLLDPRWELGVPPRSESELAWVQHCYAHTAPGGLAMLLLPASVAYRRTGRRIRAELVRQGLLSSVVALPSGLASHHSLPVHLWILRRPLAEDPEPTHIRMVDLSAVDPEDLDANGVAPTQEQVADVPPIDILDDDVDLTPSRYVIADSSDYPVEYAALRDEVRRLALDLIDLLPELPAGPGRLDGAPVGLSDLVRGSLVDLDGSEPTSLTDRLDTDYLRGFLRSTANTRRSTTASGSYRLDARSAQLPQMELQRQQEYGAAFRHLAAFEDRLRQVTALGGRASALAHDGLTNGALLPPVDPKSRKARQR
ncbi:N-6 DNA methylase [Streptacidiphilus sp. N1-10]|uniref:N-6 DNA methylase n=1 Tax=Streptacidiphilus jeojiensis TaxID=3229225 RepID=A0ABV6XFB4_9ACTN